MLLSIQPFSVGPLRGSAHSRTRRQHGRAARRVACGCSSQESEANGLTVTKGVVAGEAATKRRYEAHYQTSQGFAVRRHLSRRVASCTEIDLVRALCLSMATFTAAGVPFVAAAAAWEWEAIWGWVVPCQVAILAATAAEYPGIWAFAGLVAKSAADGTWLRAG